MIVRNRWLPGTSQLHSDERDWVGLLDGIFLLKTKSIRYNQVPQTLLRLLPRLEGPGWFILINLHNGCEENLLFEMRKHFLAFLLG